MTLFAANALQCSVNGVENPQNFPLGFRHPVGEDRSTASNMHRKIGKDGACNFGDILSDR